MDSNEHTEKSSLLDQEQHPGSNRYLLVDEEATENDVTEKKQQRNNSETLCAWMRSTNFLLYCSHALSAWGDRMWQFATGMFLVALNPNSLRLTAIYGFSSGGSILLFGAIVGNWVDKYPRLKVARASLIVQNLCVCISASIVCLTIYFADDIRSKWEGLEDVCHMCIILFAVVADVASIGRQISIERDWIVVICPDTSDLTNMSAFLRRIDLTTKLLAPIVTGQVITFGSMTIGALFIAGWNLVSVFVEYIFLHAVYKSVPALASKENRVVDTATETSEQTALLQDEQIGTDYGFVKANHSGSYGKKTELSGSDAEGLVKEEKHSRPAQICLMFFDSFVVLFRGWKTYMSQRIVFAGLGLACLYMTVMGFDNITTGYAKEQGLSESLVGILMGCGALVGILGTLAFPKVRQRVGLERTGLIALGIQVTCLISCVVSIFVPGSPFDPGYLFHEHKEPTLLPHCEPDLDNPVPILTMASMATDHVMNKVTSHDMFADDFSTMYRPLPASYIKRIMPSSMQVSVLANMDINTTHTDQGRNCTVVNEDLPTHPNSYISIILLMAGIVTSRFGLWMADLTVTQLLLETPADHERGIVNGVQNSLNSMMDLLKFVLVIVLPWPQTFGILILLSFLFVVAGTCLYALYSRKTRGHLFHFDTYQEDLLRYRFQNPETRLYVPLTT